jgi:hypothetical protein
LTGRAAPDPYAPVVTSIPPGWYPDPAVPATLRFWDGHAWTSHQHGTVSPLDQPEPSAPAGTSWNTVWIWLVVLVPVIPILLALLVPWGSMFDFDPQDPQAAVRAQLRLFTDPVQLASQLAGYAAYGLSVFFAYRDHRELRERGVPRPFHWAWAFLNPAYPIGRSIVVVRRLGRGWAPLWVAVGTIVLSFVVTGVIMAELFSAVAEMIPELSRPRWR